MTEVLLVVLVPVALVPVALMAAALALQSLEHHLLGPPPHVEDELPVRRAGRTVARRP